MPGIVWVEKQGTDSADEDFLDIFQDCFSTQFVDKPTGGSAVLEFLLSNGPIMVEGVQLREYLRTSWTSDHNIVCGRILVRVRVQNSEVRLLDFKRKANFEGKRRELDR